MNDSTGTRIQIPNDSILDVGIRRVSCMRCGAVFQWDGESRVVYGYALPKFWKTFVNVTTEHDRQLEDKWRSRTEGTGRCCATREAARDAFERNFAKGYRMKFD